MIDNFLRNAASCTIIVVLACIVFTASSFAQSDKKSSQLVGGSCQYKSYPGQATIVSIARSQTADPQQRRFEVKFTFVPKNKVAEGFAQVEGKTFNLYDNNFQNPDRDFIASKQISVGKVLDGNLQVITSGTCTPVLFDFPGLK